MSPDESRRQRRLVRSVAHDDRARLQRMASCGGRPARGWLDPLAALGCPRLLLRPHSRSQATPTAGRDTSIDGGRTGGVGLLTMTVGEESIALVATVGGWRLAWHERARRTGGGVMSSASGWTGNEKTNDTEQRQSE